LDNNLVYVIGLELMNWSMIYVMYLNVWPWYTMMMHCDEKYDEEYGLCYPIIMIMVWNKRSSLYVWFMYIHACIYIYGNEEYDIFLSKW
jgi:hypothetical protein